MSLLRRTAVAATLVAAVAVGCESPPVDAPRSEGGAAFDPLGVLAGTVQYAGPRVPCTQDATSGEPTGIAGRVVLTLFRSDNPPPPTGDAAGALNLLVVPGPTLFRFPDDCLDPAAPPEVLAEVVLRTATFEWPGIPLGGDDPVGYQIRAFFDADADFVPFFSELNQPTAGDHAGGALEADTSFSSIELGRAADHPDGQRVDGIAVNLAAVSWTERPVFTVSPDSGNLSSEATFPPLPDPLDFEQALFEQTRLTLSLVAVEDEAFLEAARGIGLDFGVGTPAHAWFLRDVDLDGDGAQDPHPVLPGVGWSTPLLSFMRVPGAAEVAAGVPPVSLVGSVRPSVPAQGKRVVAPDLETLVAPVALVDLVPGRPECQVVYVPPGNFRETYEGAPRVCQELPTGRYAVTVLQGVLGGPPFVPAEPAVSDTGFDLPGDALATQSWTVPNALVGVDPGSPDRPAPDAVLLVHDPDPEGGAGADDPRCAAAFSPVTMDVQPITYLDPPEDCCTTTVVALCDLPLCGTVGLAARGDVDLAVREAGLDGPPGVLSCTPFLPPPACCPPGE